VPLAGKGDVGGKSAPAQQQRPILEARDRAADELLFLVRHPRTRSFPRDRESLRIDRTRSNISS
jgi:hypothetical protein